MNSDSRSVASYSGFLNYPEIFFLSVCFPNTLGYSFVLGFICFGVFHLLASLLWVFSSYLQSPEGNVGVLELKLEDGCETPYGCWELKLSPGLARSAFTIVHYCAVFAALCICMSMSFCLHVDVFCFCGCCADQRKVSFQVRSNWSYRHFRTAMWVLR